MSTMIKRRALLAGALATPLLGALPAQAKGYATLTDLDLTDDEMLQLFVKLRYSLDDRVTVGWVDAVNYAFVQGETFPLYRLLAATWRQVSRDEQGDLKSVSLEVALFLDMQTGAVIDKLTMPITGQTVDVPLYRAGPSHSDITARFDLSRDFSMKQETRDGDSFFVSGRSVSEGFLSQPQRSGDDFSIRQDVNTRVYSAEDSPPGFFYREWTITRGSWSALSDPDLALVPCQLAYSANSAFRPWMKMGDSPGHTVQNGIGGRVESIDQLPAELQNLLPVYFPDLVKDPGAVLAAKPA